MTDEKGFSLLPPGGGGGSSSGQHETHLQFRVLDFMALLNARGAPCCERDCCRAGTRLEGGVRMELVVRLCVGSRAWREPHPHMHGIFFRCPKCGDEQALGVFPMRLFDKGLRPVDHGQEAGPGE